MKKYVFAALALALGAGSVQAAELKIAVVDPMQAVSETRQAKKMIADLERDLNSDKAQLGKLEGDLKGCQQKMNTDAATMSTTALAKFKAECETRYREYQNLGQSLQKIATERQQSILTEMGPKFQNAVNGLVKENGYDLVLQREAALHVRPDLDITGKVTARIDAAAAPAAPAAKK